MSQHETVGRLGDARVADALANDERGDEARDAAGDVNHNAAGEVDGAEGVKECAIAAPHLVRQRAVHDRAPACA